MRWVKVFNATGQGTHNLASAALRTADSASHSAVAASAFSRSRSSAPCCFLATPSATACASYDGKYRGTPR